MTFPIFSSSFFLFSIHGVAFFGYVEVAGKGMEETPGFSVKREEGHPLLTTYVNLFFKLSISDNPETNNVPWHSNNEMT